MRFDHLVLTVHDLQSSFAFYVGLLGFTPAYIQGRLAFRLGNLKLNIHVEGEEIEPHALFPKPGSADLCFIDERPISWWLDRFSCHGVAIELGPVTRHGTTGPIRSLYVRDPDGNLIEIGVLL